MGILKSVKRSPDTICAAIAVTALLLAICIPLRPSFLYAQGVLLPSYGQGKTIVRVYTDYFCGPCRAGEPKVEALLLQLVKTNKIKLMFIDTPAHKTTSLYAQYFLYILNLKKDFEHALSARRVLFEAASQKITAKEKLEEVLTQKGIGFKPFDPKQTFNAMSQYIKDDGVRATPTIIIDNGTEKQPFVGIDNIVNALELLK
ncbi:MAG TPA: thioredoxin domain-containing protein [Syntrophorhabdus sp.]|nr:thioredoxin domain-containing protein [Syntrophorhabdus sp.]